MGQHFHMNPTCKKTPWTLTVCRQWGAQGFLSVREFKSSYIKIFALKFEFSRGNFGPSSDFEKIINYYL